MIKHVEKVSTTVAVLSALSHIFCCGLPLVATLFGVGAAAGALTTQTVFETFFHEYENIIMGFSALMLVLGGVSQYVSWRIDCRKQGCEHPPCSPRKKLSFKLYVGSCVVFAMALAAFLALPHNH